MWTCFLVVRPSLIICLSNPNNLLLEDNQGFKCGGVITLIFTCFSVLDLVNKINSPYLSSCLILKFSVFFCIILCFSYFMFVLPLISILDVLNKWIWSIFSGRKQAKTQETCFGPENITLEKIPMLGAVGIEPSATKSTSNHNYRGAWLGRWIHDVERHMQVKLSTSGGT